MGVSRRGFFRLLVGGAAVGIGAGAPVGVVKADAEDAPCSCGLDKETVEQALTLLAIVGDVSLTGLSNHNKRIMRLERLVWEPGGWPKGRGKT